MCLHINTMCPKTKTKSRTSTKKSSKKHRCHECEQRIDVEESYPLYAPPMPTMGPAQPRYDYGFYRDWATYEDNHPATISIKQWRDHTQAAQNACAAAQDNGKRIDDAKSAMKSDIKEAQKAIRETHASVNSTESQVRETREALDLAHLSITNTQQAILKTQGLINDNHSEQMRNQQACAADVARVRDLLEGEEKKREQAHQVERMVQYAQSQGLLQPQAPGHRSQSSQSSSPATSVSSRAQEQERPSRRRFDEWEEVETYRQWMKRQRLQLEHQHYVTRAMGEAVNMELRIQADHERLLRAHGEIAALKRSHQARFPYPGVYHDEVLEAPPYNTYPYPESVFAGSGGVGRQMPRRGPLRCGNERMWGEI
ncbi:hypothetical protein F5Y08DRAFT_296953 [Xylaria arbuscula]|nr:hypothetical protein F5Y08DRAFT_296953 [Xylaria arbuscula]